MEFTTWTNLDSFDVGNNRQTGTLPTELGTWNALKFFSIQSNGITDRAWLLLSSLQSLDHYKNTLYGTLQPELSLMTALVILFAPDKSLMGALPTELGQ